MNIRDFLPAGEYKPKGSGEHAGPCPWCGGEDRFIIFVGQGTDGLGRFWCRQCRKSGDAIQFLREVKGMSYREACEALQVEPRQNDATQATKQVAKSQGWKPEPERIPSVIWQCRALGFYFECEEHLSTSAAQEALQARGLNIGFAQKHSLGWNPADRYDAPEAWGLEPWTNSKGNPGKVYLPAGLVISTFRNPGTVAVKIRRRDWQPDDNWPKYHAVRGGSNGAFILGKRGLPVVLVESELDALLIAQEASVGCSVVALPAGNRPDAQTTAFIRAASDVLYAGDFDDAGKKAFGWWREHFPSCRAWPPAAGKDILEMHQAGVSVLSWVAAGLEAKTHQVTPQSRQIDQSRVPELLPSAKTIEAYRESILTGPTVEPQALVTNPVDSSPAATAQSCSSTVTAPFDDGFFNACLQAGIITTQSLSEVIAAIPDNIFKEMNTMWKEVWNGFIPKSYKHQEIIR